MSDDSTNNIDGVEQESSETKECYGGATRATQAELEAIPYAPRLLRTTTLPSSVDLSHNFPPVGNQKKQNSCVGWAIAYALKTYQEQVERQWGVNTPEHQFSPAFIYNLRYGEERGDGEEDKGMSIPAGMDIVMKKGVCTLADMPYAGNDFKTRPNDSQKAAALRYRSISRPTNELRIPNNDISIIKEYLYTGNPVLILVPMYSDLIYLNPSNPILDSTNGEQIAEGDNHALCLVGYDDEFQHGGTKRGVFRFINSWGTTKGINGYGYIAYDFIKNNSARIETYVFYDKIDVKSISLNSSSMEFCIGDSQTLTPTILPTNATNKEVEYTSNNSNVATVSSTGRVYAASIGQTSILVTSKDTDSSATATCSVKVKDAAISLNKSSMELYIGESQVLTKTITPSNIITNAVIWSSSNPAVATINSSTGTVNAVSPGETTITVKCNYPNSSATAACHVKVKDASILLDKTYVELFALENEVLKATIIPNNSTTSNVTWSSSNPAIATISAAGRVNAVSPGEATINVRCNYSYSNAVATCRVKVKDRRDSLFISDSIPDKMRAGRTYHVSITLKNTGITPWAAWNADNNYNHCLGTDVNNNMNGALFLEDANRIRFPYGLTVIPGEIYTVNFQMQTPAQVGTYKLEFKMLANAFTWFGDIMEKNIVVFDPSTQPVLNTYGSVGTFKHNHLNNHSHYTIGNEKLKNQHWDLYDFTYSEMQAYTQNQLREGEL